MSSRPSSLLKVPSLRVSELYRPFKGRYSTLRRVETRNPKHTLKSIKRFLLLETSFLYSPGQVRNCYSKLFGISKSTLRAKWNLNRKPLWTCPKCKKKFVTRNLWHSCGRFTISQFLKGKGPRAKALFNQFVKLVRRCGPIKLSVSKTSVAFMVRVRFAGVARVSERGMTITLGLPRRLVSERIQRVEHPDSNWYVHYLRITSPKELDNELFRCVRESYKMMGKQRHLIS